MSDSEDADMDPTPRRRRRSKDLDPPDMSGEPASALQFKEEMKKIQEFVQRFPDQLKETESSVEELKKVADDIRNDRDAVVGGARASSLIRRGAAIAVVGVIGLAGAGLATFTGGASVAVAGAVAGGLTQAIAGGTVVGTVAGTVAGGSTLALASGAFAASIGAFTLKAYSKKMEEIRENASSRMTELSRSAATAIAAVLNLKRLSRSPDTAADPDHENVFEMLKTHSGLRDLTERMEELLGASGTDKLADSEIDKIAENVFPNDLGQLFSVILSFKSKEEKNEKASKIRECTEKLEENLQAGREIHTAMETLSN